MIGSSFVSRISLSSPRMAPDLERAIAHRLLNGVPRAWIESSIPIAARLAIIDDPPTLTNGSGMPVIGAIPIVMPTLT